MNSITIVIADDHLVVRQGLQALLAAESDFVVVGVEQCTDHKHYGEGT